MENILPVYCEYPHNEYYKYCLLVDVIAGGLVRRKHLTVLEDHFWLLGIYGVEILLKMIPQRKITIHCGNKKQTQTDATMRGIITPKDLR